MIQKRKKEELINITLKPKIQGCQHYLKNLKKFFH